MRKNPVLIGLAALLLTGCGSRQQTQTRASTDAGSTSSASVKRYSMHGKVLAVNTAEKSAKIDAAEIPGWMSAMTMDYPVKDASELAKMTVDRNIQATVFVDGDNFWIGEVRDAAATGNAR